MEHSASDEGKRYVRRAGSSQPEAIKFVGDFKERINMEQESAQNQKSDWDFFKFNQSQPNFYPTASEAIDTEEQEERTDSEYLKFSGFEPLFEPESELNQMKKT